MTILLYTLVGLCVVFSLVTAYVRNRRMLRARFVCKMTASLLFLGTGLTAASLRGDMTIPVALLLGALLLGFVGDIILGLDYFVRKDLQSFLFLLGGAPFFFGHVLYTYIFLTAAPLRRQLLPLLLLIPLTFVALDATKRWHLGKNTAPLLLYGLVLSAMVVGTLNLALGGGSLGKLMAVPGVLFAFSDTCLFLRRFGSAEVKRRAPLFSYLVLFPYYTAQALFALSVQYL
ncbi:MAG: lysoplasmalogenase [Oscillospiraceae bacterium]|nr:lysoplasmalogenase [Oscillospiraceae bacterium]